MLLPRAMDRWLMPYLCRQRFGQAGVTAYVIAICDHFEPMHGTDREGALQRVERWCRDYPKSIDGFVDGAGRKPKHTFFYPIEQYDEALLAGVGEICAKTGAEVEVHLHHGEDDAENLERTLESGKRLLGEHGFLSRDADGSARYGFIHGNWAIGNCHPDGLKCGVDEELQVLKRTGCYADFTMPSAPDVTQLGRVNSIYYADVHARGRAVGVGREVGDVSELGDEESMLMVQGPLGLQWRERKWGVLPKVENGDLTGVHPPTASRFHLWSEIAPRVQTRPDWVFIKLHTHGALPRTTAMFLDGPMGRFHSFLGEVGNGAACYYVTAREMVNLVHAADAGCEGGPEDFLDYRYGAPPIVREILK